MNMYSLMSAVSRSVRVYAFEPEQVIIISYVKI